MRKLNEISFKNKRVLLRTDYDVPLQKGKVADDTRIQASLPTIKYLLEKKSQHITILCHIDRPAGKVVESLRVAPIAEHLKKIFPQNALVSIEENLRFNSGEKDNNLEFAKTLAAKGEIYINDSFAVSHRNHASIVTLPKLLPSTIGLQFQKELKALDKVLKNPARPLLLIIGGAKLETKLPLIEKLTKKADEILVGGKLAQEIGSACSPEAMACIKVAQLTLNGKDITKNSAQEFASKISKAGAVVWSGPMGVFEEKKSTLGTKIIAEAVNKTSGYTVIGGGDTEAAATKFNTEKNINHISMGGGAMLQYLAEETLAGLEAIKGGIK